MRSDACKASEHHACDEGDDPTEPCACVCRCHDSRPTVWKHDGVWWGDCMPVDECDHCTAWPCVGERGWTLAQTADALRAHLREHART